MCVQDGIDGNTHRERAEITQRENVYIHILERGGQEWNYSKLKSFSSFFFSKIWWVLYGATKFVVRTIVD